MTRPHAYGIIPARYASSRFPGKPLVPIQGKPMFWHVWDRARRCTGLASVTLATDDERIARAARDLDVPCVMTGGQHASGTDRVHEAARTLGVPEDAVVVNIQGDEPALDPGSLELLLEAFALPGVSAATLAYPLDPAQACRPDTVKVVVAADGNALYFSRAPIPFGRDGVFFAPLLGHIGLYAFTMATLSRFVELAPSSLEQTEKLEQLRLLENGIPVRVVTVAEPGCGVDTPEDLARAARLLAEEAGAGRRPG